MKKSMGKSDHIIILGGWRRSNAYGNLDKYNIDQYEINPKFERAPDTIVPPLDPFVPQQIDLIPFIFAEKVIMDESTYNWLQLCGSGANVFPKISNTSIKILETLNAENIIEIIDTYECLKPYTKLLTKMEKEDKRDSKNLKRVWIESIELWNNFVVDIAKDYGADPYEMIFLLNDSKPLNRYQKALVRLFHWSGYDNKFSIISKKTAQVRILLNLIEWARFPFINHLRDVNRTLLLCNIFNARFYDWFDYEPFYYYKFNRLARNKIYSKDLVLKKIIELFIPVLKFKNSDDFMRWRNHEAIQALRDFIDNNNLDKNEIDTKLLCDIQNDIINIEKNIEKIASIISYATTPLEIIPYGGIISKAVGETARMAVRTKLRKKYSWYYFLKKEAGKRLIIN